MKHDPNSDVTPHFNGLDPAQAERLTVLSEEALEIALVIHKMTRHGFHSSHPADPATTNVQLLEKEIGHFQMMLVEMVSRGDVDALRITQASRDKRATINQWLHHNKVS